MKIRFENAADLQEGIALVAPDLGFEAVTEHAELTVTVCEAAERIVTVTLDGARATITYGDGKARFFRGLATLLGWIGDGITQKSNTERPLFATNGAMVDMSRNAVMNVTTVKEMLRRMALMGLNTYMLYTEDTYELEEYPYFGHLRGRYTKAEIRELDAYAIALGIELVPCIQMLGHLATHLRWPAAVPYKDTEEALLVGADAPTLCWRQCFPPLPIASPPVACTWVWTRPTTLARANICACTATVTVRRSTLSI